jgi:hypothetical protein
MPIVRGRLDLHVDGYCYAREIQFCADGNELKRSILAPTTSLQRAVETTSGSVHEVLVEFSEPSRQVQRQLPSRQLVASML